MTRQVLLESAHGRVRIVPELGGGLASLEALTPRGAKPVLRTAPEVDPGVFDLAMNVLVPYSNRISNGGFDHGGTFHPVAPNLDGEPFPIHGDGFQKPWSVRTRTQSAVRLQLHNGGAAPFRYDAELHYELNDATLTCTLEMTNRGPRLPFGGGFHPWFPRCDDSVLSFRAEGVWLEDARHLPTENVSLKDRPHWNFEDPKGLPADWINNAFTGWDGKAGIWQPSSGIEIDIQALSPLNTAIVYSPDESADFFCFEPVSHAVDAHNQAGQPGLAPLETGEVLRLAMMVSWRAFQV